MMKCRERLIVREPYKRFGACLNTARKVMEEIFPSLTYAEDILENEARNIFSGNWECGYYERVPKECEGLTREECILRIGELELREWCFDTSNYKYGVEIDCANGVIYVFYCEEEAEE